MGGLREKWTSSTAMLHSCYYSCFYIWNEHPRIRQTAKFYAKNKSIGTFDKNYCDTWNKHPQVCQKYIFNQNSKFWHIIFGPGPYPGRL